MVSLHILPIGLRVLREEGAVDLLISAELPFLPRWLRVDKSSRSCDPMSGVTVRSVIGHELAEYEHITKK
jgi:hypothetical protein